MAKADMNPFLAGTIGVVVGLALAFLITKLANNCLWASSGEDVKRDIIKTLLRQSARWSTAAAQDEAPMIAVLHANYGAGYLWALMDVANNDEIERATGVDVLKYKEGITSTQDAATVRAIGACPEFGPPATYLTSLGGEGKRETPTYSSRRFGKIEMLHLRCCLATHMTDYLCQTSGDIHIRHFVPILHWLRYPLASCNVQAEIRGRAGSAAQSERSEVNRQHLAVLQPSLRGGVIQVLGRTASWHMNDTNDQEMRGRARCTAQKHTKI